MGLVARSVMAWAPSAVETLIVNLRMTPSSVSVFIRLRTAPSERLIWLPMSAYAARESSFRIFMICLSFSSIWVSSVSMAWKNLTFSVLAFMGLVRFTLYACLSGAF